MLSAEWNEVDGHYEFGAARAERFDDIPVFVIRTFGADADADTAFECIRAAMPHGQFAIDGVEENRVVARLLVDDDRVRFGPFVGLPFDAFAVVAVKGNMNRGSGSSIGPPTGKTSNEKTADDFAVSTSNLATEGGSEFVTFCKGGKLRYCR